MKIKIDFSLDKPTIIEADRKELKQLAKLIANFTKFYKLIVEEG